MTALRPVRCTPSQIAPIPGASPLARAAARARAPSRVAGRDDRLGTFGIERAHHAYVKGAGREQVARVRRRIARADVNHLFELQRRGRTPDLERLADLLARGH